MKHRRRLIFRLLPAALVLVAVVALAGCGSSGDSSGAETGGESSSSSSTESSGGGESSSAGIQKAEALVAEAESPSGKWEGPKSSPPPAPDKTIGVVACGLEVPGCAAVAEGTEEAGKALGWQVIVVDGQSDPQTTTQGIDSLIARHVDAIALDVVQPSAVTEQITHAENEGIKVVSISTPDIKKYGGDVTVPAGDETRSGEIIAAYVIANGCGGIISFTSDELVQLTERVDGFESFLEANGGSDCDLLAAESIPLAQLGPPEEPIVSSLLQKNAGQVRWFFGSFDAMVRPMLTSAQSLGDTEIEAVSIDGDEEALELIRKEGGQAATVARPLKWMGWGAMDQLNRLLNGDPVVKTEGLEEQLITKSNLPPAGQPYEAIVDFKAEYERIWGQG